jgi:hypothetical protein
MKRKTSSKIVMTLACAAILPIVLAFLFGLAPGRAQTAPAVAARFVGTITAVHGNTLSVKTDAGDVRQVEVPDSAALKRIEPGQKDLNAAVTIQLSDLETGDRVLVRLDSTSTGSTPQAATIIAMKQADVAQKQQADRDAWQRSGIGGLVKSVDTASGIIVLATGAGPTAKIVTVHVSKMTVLKRYAPASVRFDQSQPGPIDVIQSGDQLRARGTKNEDGTELDAAEVVSGSFRNISGTVASLDTSSISFVVKDLMTKKQVTVHIRPDTQMHALPDMMARALAARLKGSVPANAPGGQTRATSGQAGGAQSTGQGRGQGGDMQQMLNRAPAIQFSDLKKGDAVMLVSTAGVTDVTAITLLTGVEPLLEAPEASRDLLANWSMGSGGGADAESQ